MSANYYAVWGISILAYTIVHKFEIRRSLKTAFRRKQHSAGGFVFRAEGWPSHHHRDPLATEVFWWLSGVGSVGRGSGSIRSRLGQSGRLLAVGTRVSSTVECWIFVVVADMKTKSAGIDVTVTPDEESSKYRLGQDIEDTVEYSLGVRCDDVSTLA